jgi:hypothetical protein
VGITGSTSLLAVGCGAGMNAGRWGSDNEGQERDGQQRKERASAHAYFRHTITGALGFAPFSKSD